MRRFRSDQGGFTVVELLVSSVIGLIVLTAAFTLVETSQRKVQRTAGRTDAVARGRVAMEAMTQSLRSQVCVKFDDDYALAPIQDGDATSLTYFADVQGKVAGSSATGTFAPEQRKLTYANGAFSETSLEGTGSYPSLTFANSAATPLRKRVILTDAAPVTTNAPIFTYYALKADGTVDPTALAVPLSTDDRERVVEIGIQFVAKPSDGAKSMSGTSATFTDTVGVRLPVRVDVKNLGDGPTCMI
jgi:type II secretory pathway pseudopilin PulG